MSASRNFRNHVERASSPGVVTYGTRCGRGLNGLLCRSRQDFTSGLRTSFPKLFERASTIFFSLVQVVPTGSDVVGYKCA